MDTALINALIRPAASNVMSLCGPAVVWKVKRSPASHYSLANNKCSYGQTMRREGASPHKPPS